MPIIPDLITALAQLQGKRPFYFCRHEAFTPVEATTVAYENRPVVIFLVGREITPGGQRILALAMPESLPVESAVMVLEYFPEDDTWRKASPSAENWPAKWESRHTSELIAGLTQALTLSLHYVQVAR